MTKAEMMHPPGAETGQVQESDAPVLHSGDGFLEDLTHALPRTSDVLR